MPKAQFARPEPDWQLVASKLRRVATDCQLAGSGIVTLGNLNGKTSLKGLESVSREM